LSKKRGETKPVAERKIWLSKDENSPNEKGGQQMKNG